MSDLTTLRDHIRAYTNRSSTILTDAICDEFTNRSQERMEQAHRWRGQETHWDFTYDDDDDGKDLPTDFISELVVSYNDTAQTNPSLALRPLDKLDGGRIAWLFSRSSAVERDNYYPQTADPAAFLDGGQYYYLWEAKVYIVPQPSELANYVLDYYGGIQVLDATHLTNFFTASYYNCLKWGALVEAWSFLHESVRVGTADAFFEKLLMRAVKHDQTIAMSGPPRSRGT